MKKLLSIILTLSMMLTVLAACNQNEPSADPVPDDKQAVENQSETVDIVVDGVSEYVIVRGENAGVSEITASTELQKYLKQISGAEIPIVTDSSEPVAKEIVVGKTNREADGEFNRDELGDEGFVIKTEGDTLYLVGGEQRGTLYAVYEFLEEYLGCRFYMTDIEKIPELKTVSVAKIEEDKQIPAFEFRFTNWYDYRRDSALMAKRRYNFSLYDNAPNETYGGSETWIGGHTFGWMLPYSEYGAEHPEYFAVDENGNLNLPEKDALNNVAPQLCLSNPEVIEILTESVRQWIIDNPHAKIFHISQNDQPYYCKCENCMRICQEEGGALSGTLIRALNTISEAVSEELNGRYLMTYAYQFSRSAPVTAPAENIIIQFCPIDVCAAHPITEDCFDGLTTSTDGSSNSASEDFEAWAKLTDNIMIYEYNMNWEHYNLLVPDFDNIFENFKYYNSKTINGFFWQGVLAGSAPTFTELKCYLMSKLMWDPDMTKDEYYAHMDDFLEGVYGPGWQSIKNYIMIAQEEFSRRHVQFNETAFTQYPIEIVGNINPKDSYPEEITEDMIRNYEQYDWTKYYNWFSDAIVPRVISEGEKLFADALSKAETESQKYLLEKAEFQVRYLKSIYLPVKYGVGAKFEENYTEWTYINVEDTWNGAINKILTNFFKANPDMFTKDETIQYRVAITRSVGKAIYDSYLQFNKDLYADFKRFGLRMSEWSNPMPDHLDDIALSYRMPLWEDAQELYGGQ